MNKKVVLPVVLMLSTLLMVAVFTALNTAIVTAVSHPSTPPTHADQQASFICSQLVVNGDMEEDLAWIMPPTEATAAYSTAQARSGERSIRIGIVNGTNREAYSSARQPVTIPADTVTATLTLWLYPVSTGTLAQPLVTGALPDSPVNDAQYVMILDENLDTLQVLLWTRRNTQSWEPYSFDLSAYAGETVYLLFGVYNNGIGGVTGMYLDDVALDACRPMPEQPYRLYLPIIRHGFALDPPPPADLLLIDGQVVTRVIGHPDSAAIYGLTAAGFYRSDDGADSWTLITSILPVTGTVLLAAEQPELLYAGAGFPCFKGGPPTPFWRSVDSGLTWTQILTATNLEPLAVHPEDGEKLYAQTCAGPYLSKDAGESWIHQEDELFLLYNIVELATAVVDDWQTVYIGGSSEGGSGVIIGSQDGGESWARLLPSGAEIWSLSSMALDPISTTHLYFGDGLAFWGTLDGGITWYTSTNGLDNVIYDPDDPDEQTYGLLSLVILPTNREFLLLGTAEGLFTSGDRGLTWHKVTGYTWEDARIDDLLLRTAEPDKLFLTTPDGVYVHTLVQE